MEKCPRLQRVRKGLFTQTKQSFFRYIFCEEEGKSFIISCFCAKIGVLAILLAVSIEEVACYRYLYHNFNRQRVKNERNNKDRK
ncbi:hypothetical protein EDD76_10273 [Kineothrix alysoides]|uniref:Uncharacterized protein n=1 Tax=Kineothrix alysoides TaxID=1469948 RepID=A0A4R1R4M9_9FIRM|nr:hypothetical protein EDD76_10273 [Kineothrix alysoides]